jgi:hypothetical protein
MTLERCSWIMNEAVKVGVSGHRILAEIEKLEASLSRALRVILESFPGRRMVVVSPLAEGADRLVARAVLGHAGTGLFVPLPLPVDDYLEDFASPESKAEFRELLARAEEIVDLPPAPTRDAAYEQVGEYVLDHSDVLVAVWDGLDAQGQGGTADIVGRALARGMTVIHIKAGNRKPGTTEPTSLGPEQGLLVVHNL